ncbi:hypothetical protein BD289DRAFT_160592 [Coniella lustricola]|uniref:FHA domain-containing protein n=1 Tax=Coniella lustricola TaxID=2025994 RepID=A0A2T2ZUM5_9PEZI|nr:hypothetical protein BD289DRAFT_160592 [Coniella lustricola]
MDQPLSPSLRASRPASAGRDRDADLDASRPSSQSALLPPLELLSSSPGLPNTLASTRRLSRPVSSKGPAAATASSTHAATSLGSTVAKSNTNGNASASAAAKTINGLSSHNNSNNNSNSNNTAMSRAYLKYPTPIPTSSTGILSSSPPQRVNHRAPIPAGDFVPLKRTNSIVSERAPLLAVPSVELDENGDTLLMGRSSNSSHYQLSANRLISRVHVKARYVAASVPLQPNKIEIECNGWNGLKLSCQGRTYEMHRGEVLSFEAEGAEIMLDVQDARVLVHWPKRHARDTLADLGWDSPRSGSPAAAAGLAGEDEEEEEEEEDAAAAAAGPSLLSCSPLRRATRISSPVSPTPAAAHASLQQSLRMNEEAPVSSQHSSILSSLPSASERELSVEIYEDDEDADELPSPIARRPSTADRSFVSEGSKGFSSELSEVQSDNDDSNVENNPDEENDPVVHSFGPFGHNLNNRMADFKASSPKRRRLNSGDFALSPRQQAAAKSSRRESLDDGASTPTPVLLEDQQQRRRDSADDHEHKEAVYVPDLSHVDVAVITNHIVNQLAFSRLSSTPLSTLLSNLPADHKVGLARDELKYIVENTTCIGTIPRQGKDADGKPLESQYYYIPEKDDDENRRAAVVDGLRKPTLRNCRKHHVQYYWKRPRTP